METLPEEKLVKDMTEEEVTELAKEMLPEDMKSLTEEQMNEMMENGLKEDVTDTLPQLLENNKNVFGDRYDDVIGIFTTRTFEMVNDVNEENIRNKTFSLLATMATTINQFEEEDADTTKPLEGLEFKKERRVVRLQKITQLAFRHLILAIALHGKASLEHHDTERLVNQLLYNLYTDTLAISHLQNHFKTVLEDVENKETRFLDSNITKANSIESIMVGVVLGINYLIDELIEDIEHEDIMDERNRILIDIIDKYLVKP